LYNNRTHISLNTVAHAHTHTHTHTHTIDMTQQLGTQFKILYRFQHRKNPSVSCKKQQNGARFDE